MAAIITRDESRGKYEAWVAESPDLVPAASTSVESLATILSSSYFHPSQIDFVLTHIDKLFDGTVLKEEWRRWFTKLVGSRFENHIPELGRMKFYQQVRYNDRLQLQLWQHADRRKFFIPFIEQLKCIFPTVRSTCVNGEMREELEYIDHRFIALKFFCNDPEYCHQLLASICNTVDIDIAYRLPDPFDIVDIKIVQEFLKKWIAEASPTECISRLNKLCMLELSPRQIIFLFKEYEPALRVWTKYNDDQEYPNPQHALIKLRFMLMDSKGCEKSIYRIGMKIAIELEVDQLVLLKLVKIIDLKEMPLLASVLYWVWLRATEELKIIARVGIGRIFQAFTAERWPTENEESQAKLEELFIFWFLIGLEMSTITTTLPKSISRENCVHLCRACIRAVHRVHCLPDSYLVQDQSARAISLIKGLKLERDEILWLFHQEPQFLLIIQKRLHELSISYFDSLFLVSLPERHVVAIVKELKPVLSIVLNPIILSYLGIRTPPPRPKRCYTRCYQRGIRGNISLVFNAIVGCCRTKEKRKTA